MSLERFLTAQSSGESGFVTALSELRAGRKRSHWIWYIFPQLAGLGHSSTARLYAVRDFAEASEYLAHPLLRTRLEEVTAAVGEQLDRHVPLVDLLGSEIDAIKIVSSLTLFEHVAAKRIEFDTSLRSFLQSCTRILASVERQGFARCAHTLTALTDYIGGRQN
jgi:uncharacterized protein (DUF1810 family)